MKLLSESAATALLLLSTALAASPDPKNDPPAKACTLHHTTSDSFFDLNPLTILPPPKDDKKKPTNKPTSWHVRGHEYGANFTLNFCAPVIEDLEHIAGISSSLAKNVGAFYEFKGKTYSIGQNSSVLALHKQSVILKYADGSPCDEGLTRRKILDDDDDDDDKKKGKHKDDKRRKSTIVSVSCDNTPLVPGAPKVSLTFAGTVDECSYFFTARSAYACPTFDTTPQQLGPGGVFGVILLIAALVYFVGGCVYQRTVMHQRGWKQLPNYSMWEGIFGFVSDFFIILTSSCARFLPSRRGYSRVSLNGNSRGRGVHSDDENRLIDQLDEEWDD